jgi:N-acetylmuramoyl-L-alanine amidase
VPLKSTAARLAQRLLPLLAAILSLFMAIHLAFAATPAHANPPAAEVSAARVAGTDSRTRFVADLDRPVSYSVYVISDPYRVVVDMHDVRFNMPASLGEASKGLIREFRFGQVAPGQSRIVIETEGPVLIEKSFVLNAANGEPARMVIDLVQTDERTFARVKSTEQPALADSGEQPPRIEPASAPNPVPQSLTELLTAQLAGDEQADASGTRVVPKPRPKPQQVAALSGAARDAATPAVAPAPSARPVVVIDPGHGGVDGGTVSSNGVKEKDVVLDFARELARALKKTGRYEVHMTRDDDTFISLGKRVRIARGHKADLFIAIHADSLRQRGVRGATVYTLSEEASDEEAAALAEKENAADIIGGIDLGEDIDAEVSGILLDLALRETKNHSIYFARRVVKSLGPVSPLNHRPMRSAGFKVLKAPDVPSVLLELGYLSNRHDEKNLISHKWREKAAGAVSDAIDAFFSPEVAARQSAAN